MKDISIVPDMQSAADALHAETLAGVWPRPHLYIMQCQRSLLLGQ